MSGGALGVRGAPLSPEAEFGTLPAHIEQRIEYEPMSGCWLWTGALCSSGHAQITYRKRRWMLHRFTYTQLVGSIPDGLVLDHLCCNRACCNPHHVEPVTAAENIRRGDVGWNHRDKTHCPQGHPYDEENTYRYKNKRMCRTCMAAATKRRETRRAA